ncbi:MAG: DNA polymerase III subunit delta' [Gammaproteobacteria bacterium]|nr:DNA polymerase III subunit delta' [Gammaproteobacteria bacterium]HJO11418.1 DNA polymerase III subunit delta' [Gammaproteobacteria bacterium]
MHTEAPYAWQQQHWQSLCRQRQKNRLSHAFLICGDTGLGKRDFALSFARLLLCQSSTDNQSCGNCRSCRMGQSGHHPDLRFICAEEGSKVITIDQVRALLEFVSMTSHAGGCKIALLDRADSLNRNAANALLKTLEEPTDNTFLFLITDSPGTLLPTIHSRCQHLNFTEPTREVARTWLASQLAEGDIDAALTASGNRPLQALSMLEAGHIESRAQILQSLHGILCQQLKPEEFVKFAVATGELLVMGHLSNILSILIKYLLTRQSSLVTEATLAELARVLARLSDDRATIVEDLLVLHGEVELAKRQLRGVSNPNPQLIVESLIWRWTKLATRAGSAAA